MNVACNLTDKKCVPCEGAMPPFSHEQVQEYLDQVQGWALVEDKKIEKNFKFKNFKEALAFVNKVGEIAERENHHPDINLHNWNQVKLTLSTHAIKGLSENDFILAAKVDTL